MENAKNNKVLEQFLSQATIMVVSVTASTTQGSNLNEAELEVVVECADVAVKLTDYKKKIFEYVESRMMFIAPICPSSLEHQRPQKWLVLSPSLMFRNYFLKMSMH